MSNKPQIAFLLTKLTKKGGISRVVSIISNEIYLSQLFDIHIISYQQRDLQGYNWNKNLIMHDLVEDKLPMKKGLLKATRSLRRIIDRNKIKVLISCGHLVGPLAVTATLFNKTKIIYWSHSSFMATTSNKFRVFNEYFTVPFSSTVVCLTKADIKNYRKVPLSGKVIQIYNPIDPKLENTRKSYNIGSKKIISVGRLTYQKNFELLVDVAKLVLDKYPDYSWHIFGSGEAEERLLNRIKQNNLEGKLVLMGQVNNLYDLYNNYSMMVMTSRYEGFPMTLLEGLVCQLPLISFDVPTGPNEIIRDNVNGFLIKPFDVESMAEKISQLISDEVKRESFSNKCIDFINEFNITSINEKWITIIRENLNKI